MQCIGYTTGSKFILLNRSLRVLSTQGVLSARVKGLMKVKIMAIYKTSTGLYLKYENMNLKMEYTRCAPSLKSFLDFLIATPIWEQMLMDTANYNRRNAFSISKTTGMSGREDWFLLENREIMDEMVTVGHHILHISCANALNEGVHCFGPDFIALLWDSFYELTYQTIKENEGFDKMQPCKVVEPFFPAGKIKFFFDREDNSQRIEYLLDLVKRFRKESRACLDGTLNWIKSYPVEKPIEYFNCLSESLSNEINNLQEDDFFLLKLWANKINIFIEEDEDPEFRGRRRRVTRKPELVEPIQVSNE